MKKAAALKYNSNAPILVAKGKGKIAKKIVAKAIEFDIPILKNKELVEALFNIEIGKNVPPELFDALVEIYERMR